MKRYFVAYATAAGFGNAEVGAGDFFCIKKITEKILEKDPSLGSICIVNFFEMKPHEAWEEPENNEQA